MVNFISLTLKESIINSSQLFMSPFSADSLRNCLFRLLNNCDCYKFTATPCALNMHLECWPPAAISLSLCLSFIQITQLFSFSISHSLSEPSYRLKELATHVHREVSLHSTPTLVSIHVLVKYHYSLPWLLLSFWVTTSWDVYACGRLYEENVKCGKCSLSPEENLPVS